MESMSWSFWSPARGPLLRVRNPQEGERLERGKTRRMKQSWEGSKALTQAFTEVPQLSAQHGGLEQGNQGLEKAKAAQAQGPWGQSRGTG